LPVIVVVVAIIITIIAVRVIRFSGPLVILIFGTVIRRFGARVVANDNLRNI
jgi:hypothetical protein